MDEMILRKQLAAKEECYRKIIAQSSLQLYRFVPTENKDIVEPEPLGSSVIAKYKGRVFLITAAHVYADEEIAQVGCFIGDDPIIFQKKPTACNNCDMAIVMLDDYIVAKLKSINIVPCDLIIPIESNDKSLYYLYGFPASKVKEVADKNKRRIEPFFFSSQLLTKEEINNRKIGDINIDTQLVLDFHKDKLASFKTAKKMKQQGPKPQGLSGCGLWLCSNNRAFLVGIMTEFRMAQSALIGYKVEELKELFK